jgi:hypothetical protein
VTIIPKGLAGSIKDKITEFDEPTSSGAVPKVSAWLVVKLI